MKWMKDASNDALMSAAMPSIERFLKPMIEDARTEVHKLLVGDMPENLSECLGRVFNSEVTEAEAVKTWTAVRMAFGKE